jgi:hypothetical protein
MLGPRRSCELHRSIGRTIRLLFAVFFWYVSSYILMMDWREQVYNPAPSAWGNRSAYRMSRTASESPRPGWAARCWANWVFEPIDSLVNRAVDAATSHNLQWLDLVEHRSVPFTCREDENDHTI